MEINIVLNYERPKIYSFLQKKTRNETDPSFKGTYRTLLNKRFWVTPRQ